MYIDRIYSQPQCFLHLKTDCVCHTLSHGVDSCAILNDHMDLNIKKFTIIVNKYPARRIARNCLYDPISKIPGCQSHHTIRLQGGMICNGCDRVRGDMDTSQ